MTGFFKKAISLLIVFVLLFSACSTIFCGSVAFAEQQNEYANIVNATAKMRRPLYMGLDSRVITYSDGTEWNYFDPQEAADLLEVTLEFSDGRTKTFAIDSQIQYEYSHYVLDLDFDSINVNTQTNPLEQGKSYKVPISYYCNYYGPYTIEIDMVVEVEIAAETVTGLSARATNAIPTDLIDRLDVVSSYLAHPQVALTLSNGEEIPINVNDQEYSHRLFCGKYVYFEEVSKSSIVWGNDGKGKCDIGVYFGDDHFFETKMPVTFESYGGIDNVSGKANEPVYEGAQASYDEYSEETSYGIYQHDIDITVNFKNGKSLTYNVSDDDFHCVDLHFKYDSTQWKVGDNCIVDVQKYYEDEYGYYYAVTLGSFNIEFKPNPVESFSVRTVSALEYEDDGYFEYEDGKEYFNYFFERCRPLYTLKFNDGRPDMIDATLWEVGNLGFRVNQTEQKDKPLELGVNVVTASIGDVTSEYNVYVVENFIKDVRVKNGMTVIDGMFGEKNYDYDYETYEENIYYTYLPQFFDAELEVVLYDDTVITENTISNKNNIDIFASNRFSWSGDKLSQNANNYWKVGDNFELTLEVKTANSSTFKLQVPVTVKPNETDFELGWSYEDPKYGKGLGVRIDGLKQVSEDQKLVIPREIYGYPVNSVESLYCFGYMHGMLETVILPDSVTYLSQNAFDSMRSMEYLYLGNVENISQAHFQMGAAYEVEFSKDNKYYTAAEGVIYNKDMTEVVAITRMDDVSIAPTVKEYRNDLLQYSDYLYCDFTVTILGKDTRLIEIDNSDEYSEKTPFPFIRCYKGSAAEADAKALGIKYTTFSDIPLDGESTQTPITVTANEDAELPEDTKLSVKTVDVTDEKQVVYDITLKSGDLAVQPKTPVTVAITLPEGMNSEYAKVYRLETDGTKTNMKATYKDGKMVFTTDHFSLYSIEEVVYTPGDINDDDTIDLMDVVALAQVVADWEIEHNAEATDVNGDGDVSLLDVVHLAQYTAEWDGIELH